MVAACLFSIGHPSHTTGLLFVTAPNIFGIPLPSSKAKDTTIPFPCQHHACGCLTAEQCWKDCCCFSPKERLAWAREHGVQAPAHLVAEVVAQSKHESSGSCGNEHESCSQKRSCCPSPGSVAVTGTKPPARGPARFANMPQPTERPIEPKGHQKIFDVDSGHDGRGNAKGKQTSGPTCRLPCRWLPW